MMQQCCWLLCLLQPISSLRDIIGFQWVKLLCYSAPWFACNWLNFFLAPPVAQGFVFQLLKELKKSITHHLKVNFSVRKNPLLSMFIFITCKEIYCLKVTGCKQEQFLKKWACNKHASTYIKLVHNIRLDNTNQGSQLFGFCPFLAGQVALCQESIFEKKQKTFQRTKN